MAGHAATTTGRSPRIGVKAGLYTAVIGALGAILTLFAIPVAPNIHLNLYVIPPVLVGGTSGPLLGLMAGFIGSLYTPVLWGWVGAFPYAMGLGLGAGYFAQRFGIRPTIGAFIAHVILLPYSYWSQVNWLGLPFEIFIVGVVSTTIQLGVAGVISEVLMSVPAIRKRVPRMEIAAPSWVANNPLIRHPWLNR